VKNHNLSFTIGPPTAGLTSYASFIAFGAGSPAACSAGVKLLFCHQRFTPDAKFDPDEYLKGSFTVFKGKEDYEVVVEFDVWATDLIRGRTDMADTIRRRMQQQDEFADAAVEPAVDAYRRSDFRRRAREAWQQQATPVDLAADLGIPVPRLRTLLAHRWFGTAWAAIELHSPVLVRRRVRFADLPRQIAYARDLLEPQPITDAACP